MSQKVIKVFIFKCKQALIMPFSPCCKRRYSKQCKCSFPCDNCECIAQTGQCPPGSSPRCSTEEDETCDEERRYSPVIAATPSPTKCPCCCCEVKPKKSLWQQLFGDIKCCSPSPKKKQDCFCKPKKKQKCVSNCTKALCCSDNRRLSSPPLSKASCNPSCCCKKVKAPKNKTCYKPCCPTLESIFGCHLYCNVENRENRMKKPRCKCCCCSCCSPRNSCDSNSSSCEGTPTEECEDEKVMRSYEYTQSGHPSSSRQPRNLSKDYTSNRPKDPSMRQRRSEDGDPSLLRSHDRTSTRSNNPMPQDYTSNRSKDPSMRQRGSEDGDPSLLRSHGRTSTRSNNPMPQDYTSQRSKDPSSLRSHDRTSRRSKDPMLQDHISSRSKECISNRSKECISSRSKECISNRSKECISSTRSKGNLSCRSNRSCSSKRKRPCKSPERRTQSKPSNIQIGLTFTNTETKYYKNNNCASSVVGEECNDENYEPSSEQIVTLEIHQSDGNEEQETSRSRDEETSSMKSSKRRKLSTLREENEKHSKKSESFSREILPLEDRNSVKSKSMCGQSSGTLSRCKDQRNSVVIANSELDKRVSEILRRLRTIENKINNFESNKIDANKIQFDCDGTKSTVAFKFGNEEKYNSSENKNRTNRNRTNSRNPDTVIEIRKTRSKSCSPIRKDSCTQISRQNRYSRSLDRGTRAQRENPKLVIKLPRGNKVSEGHVSTTSNKQVKHLDCRDSEWMEVSNELKNRDNTNTQCYCYECVLKRVSCL